MRPRVKFQEPVGSPQHHPAVVLVSRERKAASLFSDETAQKYPKACLHATKVNKSFYVPMPTQVKVEFPVQCLEFVDVTINRNHSEFLLNTNEVSISIYCMYLINFTKLSIISNLTCKCKITMLTVVLPDERTPRYLVTQ